MSYFGYQQNPGIYQGMLAQNKIEALQAHVSQLQLAQATSNVLRFPNSWSFAAGQFPPVIA